MTRIEIREAGYWWLIRWPNRVTVAHSAADALCRVRRASQRRARSVGADVVVIEWDPTTPIGRAAVRAIQ